MTTRLVDDLAADGVAYVPFFPLGGFSPLQSTTLSEAAASLGVTPMQVALAWLLQRAPNILLIPGTSSLAHLRENLSVGEIRLDFGHARAPGHHRRAVPRLTRDEAARARRYSTSPLCRDLTVDFHKCGLRKP